jgi:hypothetical protein
MKMYHRFADKEHFKSALRVSSDDFNRVVEARVLEFSFVIYRT